MNDKGEIISKKKLPSNGEIVDFLKKFGERMEVAIEATPSWYWLYDHLEDEGLCAFAYTMVQALYLNKERKFLQSRS